MSMKTEMKRTGGLSLEARDAAWERVRWAVRGLREDAWLWLHVHGPATTAELAAGMGTGLLTVRPRVSELVAMGFVECKEMKGHEGVYRARTAEEARAEWEFVFSAQKQLDLGL